MRKAEMVKRLKEGCEAEPYFPGVLGNPVTFAARWGLPLSKGYRDFEAKQLAAQKRLPAKSRRGGPRSRRRPGSVPKLTFHEFENLLAICSKCHSLQMTEQQPRIWQHIRTRIREVNRLGAERISRARNALLDFEPRLGPSEGIAFNGFDLAKLVRILDKEVFGP